MVAAFQADQLFLKNENSELVELLGVDWVGCELATTGVDTAGCGVVDGVGVGVATLVVVGVETETVTGVIAGGVTVTVGVLTTGVLTVVG